MHTNRVFGTVKYVLFIELSSFQGLLNKGFLRISLYMYLVASCRVLF